MATPAAPSKVLLAAAAINGLLALGHTAKGQELAAHPSVEKLPKVIRGALLTGWFEGSVFFAILGALNYKWAYAGLVDTADKGIAGLFTALLLGAGTSYARSGDAGTGTILSLFAILQGIGAKRAAL